MTLYNSVQYAAMATLGTMGDGRDHNAKLKIFPFHWVTVATSGPTVNLCQVPAGFKPAFVWFKSEALSASAGVGLTISIGDAGDGTLTTDVDRLMAALDCDAANTYAGLDLAAANIEYTADTLIVATVLSGKTPIVSKIVTGFLVGTVVG